MCGGGWSPVLLAVCLQGLAERGWPAGFLAGRLGASIQNIAVVRGRKGPRVDLALEGAVRNCRGEVTASAPAGYGSVARRSRSAGTAARWRAQRFPSLRPPSAESRVSWVRLWPAGVLPGECPRGGGWGPGGGGGRVRMVCGAGMGAGAQGVLGLCSGVRGGLCAVRVVISPRRRGCAGQDRCPGALGQYGWSGADPGIPSEYRGFAFLCVGRCSGECHTCVGGWGAVGARRPRPRGHLRGARRSCLGNDWAVAGWRGAALV
ncbi:hypothetical protein OV450_8016 [Actinobacteria bacterium OV450]|nr:hypothetical protein OV450_8016 [Actinobacteria bacterium OV450]